MNALRMVNKMTFSDFIEKQEGIYKEFKDTSKVELEGIVPKVIENQGGYIIAYRHSNNIVDGISEISEKVSKIIPSIIYNEHNIHTTLATFQVCDDFAVDNKILESITNILYANLPLVKDIKIEYNQWLMNQDSGIVAGNPNVAFFENARKIVDYAGKRDIQLKSPWGAHITVSRFLEKVSNEHTLELLRLFKSNKPLGISIPEYVDVGYFVLTSKEFKLNVHQRFKL